MPLPFAPGSVPPSEFGPQPMNSSAWADARVHGMQHGFDGVDRQTGLRALLAAYNRIVPQYSMALQAPHQLQISPMMNGGAPTMFELPGGAMYQNFFLHHGVPGAYPQMAQQPFFAAPQWQAPQHWLQWMGSNNDSGHIFFGPQLTHWCPGGGATTPTQPTLVARKPVIYLYPEATQNIVVTLDVPGDTMLCEYPKRVDGAWCMRAEPSGRLTDERTGKSYSALFWEAELAPGLPFNLATAHCVAGADTEAFLEGALHKLGLNDRERSEFLMFWLPRMERNAWNYVHFAEEEYTRRAPLDISPAPDVLTRVFMVYRSGGERMHTSPKPLPEHPQERRGFVAVEWGGMCLDGDGGHAE